MRPAHAHAVCCAVFVTASRVSFVHVNDWLEEVRQTGNKHLVVTLVGNKADLEGKRQVSTAEAQAFADKYRLAFVEVSAKMADDVKQAFEKTASNVYERVRTGVYDEANPAHGVKAGLGAPDAKDLLPTAAGAGALFHALVARGKTVLSEFTARSGNFPTITRVLLNKLTPETDTRSSVLYDSVVFHYLIADGVVYLCVADEACKRRAAFGFLDDIKQRFIRQFGRERIESAIAFAMHSEFQDELASRMVCMFFLCPFLLVCFFL